MLDGLASGHAVADEEDARHWLAGADAIEGEPWQGLAVVSQQNAVLAGRPGANVRIGRPGQDGILDPDDIEIAQSPQI